MSAVTLRSELRAHPATDAGLQRARGSLDLVLGVKNGRTSASRVFQDGALKVRFPRQRLEAPEAVLLNLAGGLAGGDAMDVSVRLQAGAQCVVTSQACERVYRSLGDDARMMTRLSLEAGAALDWLPQPTILFDAARLKRHTQIDMAEDASVLAVESMIFGRTAMAETVRSGALDDGWRVRRGGILVFADNFRLEGLIQSTLDKPSVLNGAQAYATILYVAPDAQGRLEEARAILGELDGQSAASTWNGLLNIRLVAPGGYILNRDLNRFLMRFRKSALPRVWSL